MTLLRFVRCLLRLCRYQPAWWWWMIEGTAHYNGMDAKYVRGLSIIWRDIEWFFGTWVLQCSHLLERLRVCD